jgi:predicted metalloprotease
MFCNRHGIRALSRATGRRSCGSTTSAKAAISKLIRGVAAAAEWALAAVAAGIIIFALGYCALTSLGGLGGGTTSAPSTSQSPTAAGASGVIDPTTERFANKILGSTEDTWTKIFAAAGQKYEATPIHYYRSGTTSGCGAAQSAMGPFYCPTDKKIYLDASFFDELSQRFQAPGDFAEAYVIAHEVGHHVQDLEGTLDKAHNAQARAGDTQGNAIQVGVELQADCYAGVWAKNARDSKGQSIMEAGDIEEGLKAANAIGDDTLQRETQGRVMPDKFTHGSSAQRVAALRKGYDTGDAAQCAI